MKKFFKSLAVLLALTLVIGTVPASAASTATLKQTSKVLFLDGSKGASATDEKVVCKIKNFKSIAKMLKGVAEDDVITAKSDNKAVAIVSAKKNIVAKGIGTANVTVKVNGEEVGKIAVTVKKNAAEKISLAAPEGVETFEVGKEYTFVATRQGADGQLDTDLRRIVAVDGVKATAANAAGTKQTVVFEKPGEYELKAEAYQSKKFDKATGVSEAVKVKAVLAVESVEQSSVDTVAVTFAADVEALKIFDSADDYVMSTDAPMFYYTIGSKTVPFSAIKGVKVEKNVAYVTFFTAFTADKEYFVNIDGEAKSFVAAGSDEDDVESIVFVTKEAVANVGTEIEIQLLNKAGVDITTDALLNNVTFTTDDAANCYLYGNNITMYEAGKQATVKASFVYYTGTTYEKHEITGSGVIAGVKAPAAELVDTYFTFGAGADLTKDSDTSKFTNQIAVGDTGVYAEVALIYTLSGKKGAAVVGKDDFANYTLSAKVANENIALISGSYVSGKGWSITPNQTGSTYVLIYGTNVNDSKDVQVIATCPITVVAKRVPTKLTIEADGNYLNANTSTTNNGFVDKLTIKATVLDQYGIAMKDQAVTAVQNQQSVNAIGSLGISAGSTTNSDGEAKFEITGTAASAVKNGSALYTFKVADTCNTAQAGFQISTPGVAQITARVFESDTTKMDTALAEKNNVTDVATMQLMAYAGSYKVGPETIHASYGQVVANGVTADSVGLSGSVSSAGAYYILRTLKDGQYTDLTALSNNWYGLATTDITLQNFKVTGASIDKLAKGTYAFELYTVKVSDGPAASATISAVTKVEAKYITVTDSQKLPTVSLIESKAANVATNVAVSTSNATNGTTDLFEVRFGDDKLVAYPKTVTNASNNDAWFITNLNATLVADFKAYNDPANLTNTAESFYNFVIPVTVNQLIYKK